VAAALVFSSSAVAAEPQVKVPSPAEVKFFEERVRPVLVQRCQGCHGPQKQRSGLRVDSPEALRKGGEHGPALADKADESLLLKVVSRGEPFQMPPRDKLPDRERADLITWIRMGAPWPGGSVAVRPNPEKGGPNFTAADRAFWAFQKPTEPNLPAVRDRAWVRTPIDQFILAGLEAKGLRPAPAAERRALLRRVTYDLIGLPPTPDEIEAFVKDTRADAYERVVDRLLASPRYGERWGRHWLDVARYADSNGMDENLAFANAWRYRDYVIAAFNKDKPYDRFVREQLAGDLLTPDPDDSVNAERLIATGFLSLGPKMLAEDDPVKMQMDIVDEQIDTVGRTFLGLTLGCARCHDHKFDPLPMADYYSLAGIFKSTKTMDTFSVVARWHERPFASKEAQEKQRRHQETCAERKALLQTRRAAVQRDVLAEVRGKASAYVEAAGELQKVALKTLMNDQETAKVPGVLVIEAENFDRGNVLKDTTHYGPKIGVILNKGELPNFAEYDVKVAEAGVYQLELRYAAADSRPVQVLLNGKVVKSDAAGSKTGSWFPDTQTWAAECLVTLRAGVNTLRLFREQPFPHIDKFALVPRQALHGTALTPEQWAVAKDLRSEILRQWLRYLDEKKLVASAKSLEQTLSDPQSPFAMERVDALAPAKELAELNRLREEIAGLEKSAPKLPEAMSVGEGTIANVRIHLRGNHLTLGPEVPRQFPRILAGDQQTPVDGKQSGRLQLAEWITRPDHPLTARVMLNRIWRGHFGQGLVRSADNFGKLGERPDLPALLDWLAVRFVQTGWSVKAMHRLIVLSNTYQMSTSHNEKAAQADPEKRLYWRKERRRLEVEAVRDALLAVSGQLDLTMGGSLLKTPNRAYVASTFSVDQTNYETRRRSVYLPVVRSALYDVFQAFDFADPSVPNGERATTTVAPQALFMMNSSQVQMAATQLALDLLSKTNLNEGDRIRLLYERCLGRTADDRETERALAFVKRMEKTYADEKVPFVERRQKAWQSLCRVILASNEFIYVE
jgi:hypothetical protein